MSTMDEDVAKRILDMLTKGEKPLEVQTDAADNSTEAVLEEAPVKRRFLSINRLTKKMSKRDVKQGKQQN